MSDVKYELIVTIVNRGGFEAVKKAEKLENLCIFEKSQEEIDAYFADELAEIEKIRKQEEG